jgi:hypothetical protein
VKIQDQSDAFVCQPKIGEQLSFVNREYVLQAFDFQNEGIIHNQVKAIPAIKINAFIFDRNW